MIARLTMCVCAGAVLAALPCRAISSSQVDHKIRRFAERNKAAEMVRAMEAVGIDTSDVSVEIRDRGNTVQLNGSVPCQKEFDRIPSVIEFYGPFRNVRNHIKVKSHKADDGIVVEVDMFHKVTYVDAADTNACPVCTLGTPCEKLYAEREELLKQLKPLYLRRISEKYVVFDKKAAPLLKRFQEVSDLLDVSACYEHGGKK